MLHFHYSSTINAPVATVWEFHERSDILQILTPPWQPVSVVRRQGGLGVGAVSEFWLWLGPIPIPWIARHTACEPYRFFIDIQEKGPMVSWVHRHDFVEKNGNTNLTDSINYELPGGFLGEALLGWLVNIQLQAMFRYRHEVTQRECDRAARNHEISNL